MKTIDADKFAASLMEFRGRYKGNTACRHTSYDDGFIDGLTHAIKAVRLEDEVIPETRPIMFNLEDVE